MIQIAIHWNTTGNLMELSFPQIAPTPSLDTFWCYHTPFLTMGWLDEPFSGRDIQILQIT